MSSVQNSPAVSQKKSKAKSTKENNGVLSRFGMWLARNILEIMISLLVLYATLPFISPIAFKLGLTDIGEGIQNVYHVFCHQRVERSLFLFGEDSPAAFYTVDELKADHDIPLYNVNAPVPQWTETYFGYPYWGNDKIGYKVAFCLRDIGLYWGLAITAIIAYWYTKKNNKNLEISWKLLVLIMLPMAIDGTFQTAVEVLGAPWMSEELLKAYIAYMPKRIVTGGLFGIGFGVFMVKYLYYSVSALKAESVVEEETESK